MLQSSTGCPTKRGPALAGAERIGNQQGISDSLRLRRAEFFPSLEQRAGADLRARGSVLDPLVP